MVLTVGPALHWLTLEETKQVKQGELFFKYGWHQMAFILAYFLSYIDKEFGSNFIKFQVNMTER